MSTLTSHKNPKHILKVFQHHLDFFIYAFTITKDWDEFLRIKQDVLLKVADIISKHKAEIAYPTTSVLLKHETND